MFNYTLQYLVANLATLKGPLPLKAVHNANGRWRLVVMFRKTHN